MKKMFMFLRNLYRTVKFIYKNGNVKLLGLKYFLLGLCNEAKTILITIFPALIVYFLEKSQINVGYIVILIYSLLMFILGLLIEYFQVIVEVSNIDRYNKLKLFLNQKTMRLKYDDFISYNRYLNFEKAVDGIYEANDVDFYLISTVIPKTITILLLSYIFIQLNVFLYFFVLFTIFIVFIFEKKIENNNYKYEKLKTDSKRKINYLESLMFNLSNFKEIKLYAMNKFLSREYEESYSKIIKINHKKNIKEFAIDSFTTIIGIIRTIVIYVVAILNYNVTIYSIAAFTIYVNAVKQLTYTLYQLISITKSIYSVSLYYEDYKKYLELEENPRLTKETNLSNTINSIVFSNVSFRYPNSNNYALKNISFEIKSNEKITIVGDNGAGKSTIINLLLGLYEPTEGDIFINGINIRELNYSNVSKEFMSVFQEISLLPYSIKENISFKINDDQVEVESSLEKVGLLNIVKELKNGENTYYTKLFSDDGVEFSGGELQRFAIARAIYKNGSCAILDEPTSSLDPIKEYEIFKIVNDLLAKEICIFISHRMSSSKFSDKIIVLEKGKIVEIGKHEELVRNKKLYYEMFTRQASYYEP